MANTKPDPMARQTPLAGVNRLGLTEYRAGIDRFHASQPNSDLLESIRAYNHDTVDSLAKNAYLWRESECSISAHRLMGMPWSALLTWERLSTLVGLDVDQPVEVLGH